MPNKKVVIIGSGLGGLSCGVILSKNGYDVTILEQGSQIGGCLQCFYRKGAKFETGMHFVGSAAEGQTLDRILNYLEVKKDITLSPLDTKGYDIIQLQGQKFAFANGKEPFIETLAQHFPHQKDNLKNYFELVEKVSGASSLHSLKYAESDIVLNMKYQMVSINETIDQMIDDPLLREVLVGNMPLYAAQKNKTPFALHAFITDFYNKSSFRIVGGSDKIAISMKNTIEKYGGKIITKHKATKISCNTLAANGVIANEDTFFDADYVISDAHPARTLELIDTKLIRPAFRKRIMSIPQTPGCFCVYVEFKENTVPYMNYNYYGYNTPTTWDSEKSDSSTWPKSYLYMHLCSNEVQTYATTGVVIAYMNFADVMQWQGTKQGARGTSYEDFKMQKANILIDNIEKNFKGFRQSIKNFYTSTPLTYLDYTGTQEGSMYGVAKDVTMPEFCRITHKMRIPNVFQTGQNINSHGILGVLVGSVVTCSEFLTAQEIYRQITECN
jgi:all-trans-retinol 13,14-reductase